ncbi:C-type lectin domain family 4 member F-like [Neocloeon triangulifer]|uniref:C-type lectin domain family 4 member F-like n=1 Tax=Neocloeon triangulifer TaxID=2078957 RepID=UPI00286F1073|nr:C-type lectin domain family 4 member F-like [Neocloeon triangulifer]
MGATSVHYVALFFFYILALFAFAEGTETTCSSCKGQDCSQLEKSLKKSEFLITEIKDIMLEKESENRLVRKQIVDSNTATAKAIEKLTQRLGLVEASSKTLANSVAALNSRSNEFSEELKTVTEVLNSTSGLRSDNKVQECDVLAEELAKAKSDFELQLNETKRLYEMETLKYNKLQLMMKTHIGKIGGPNMLFANGVWYQFVNSLMTWRNAKSYCENLGMVLPDVKTGPELAAVWAKAKGINSPHGWWIHGTDEGRPRGSYLWSDGSVVDVNAKNGLWYAGHPYNYTGHSGSQCLCFWYDKQFVLLCTEKKPFICAIPM